MDELLDSIKMALLKVSAADCAASLSADPFTNKERASSRDQTR
jgi:hypothetical protein